MLGVCGGLQMLGRELIDPYGVDGNARGLGLLPLITVFDRDKTVRHTKVSFGNMIGMWSSLSKLTVEGYEIHHGQTTECIENHLQVSGAREITPNLAWQNKDGNVFGCYLHGLFEDTTVLQSLFGSYVATLDNVFDGLANFLQTHVEHDVLNELIKRK